MDEQIIISSEKHSIKNINLIICAIGVLAVIVYTIIVGVINPGYYTRLGIGGVILYIIEIPICKFFLLPVIVILLIVNGIYYASKYSLVVTNKNVKGRVTFGKEVTLPNDSLSAISKVAFHGIGVSTASGLIKFRMIENRDDIYSVINDIINQRQGQQVATTIVNNQSSNADELKKFSDLLAQGIITQEEFDAKKKQLLGL